MQVQIKTDAKYTQKVHTEERIAGKRAKFHVYHMNARKQGRFDVSYAKTAEDAAAEIYKHFKGKVTVLWVVPMDQSVSI